MNARSLRDNLLSCGLIGPGSDPPLRLVSFTCVACGMAQHLVLPKKKLAKCIGCFELHDEDEAAMCRFADRVLP